MFATYHSTQIITRIAFLPEHQKKNNTFQKDEDHKILFKAYIKRCKIFGKEKNKKGENKIVFFF